jgi:hypothetical protein
LNEYIKNVKEIKTNDKLKSFLIYWMNQTLLNALLIK